MYAFIFLFYFFILIFSINCLIEQYTLSNIGENLFLYSSVYEYVLYEKELYNINIKLTKRIVKKENKIVSKNYLSIDNKEEKEVNFNDIGSFYIIDKNIIICPRDKFHPIIYNDNLEYKIPENFIEKEKWDLKCYQSNDEAIRVIYLMNGENNSFIFSKNGYKLNENKFFSNNIYDFKLIKINNENIDSMLSISLVQGNIELINSNPKIIKSNILSKAKSFSQAYFDKNNYFYFISFNNATDFVGGYGFLDENNEFNSLNIKINTKLSIYFDENIETKEINLVPDNNYIFYKIFNKTDSKIYNGFIDIKLNKIIFNINEEIESFSFYPNSFFLIITTFSAYKIPIMKNNLISFHEVSSSNQECYELCETCKEYSNNETAQKCLKCKNNFILKGENCVCEKGKKKSGQKCVDCENQGLNYQLNSSGNVCAKNCTKYDSDSYHCLICDKGFKNVDGLCFHCNITHCFNWTENTCECNKCEDKYYLNETENVCEECDENCYTCIDISTKCTDCKINTFLENNKCYNCTECKETISPKNCRCKSCNEGKYLDNDQCVDCMKGCKTCTSTYCLECKDGYYFNDYKCLSCYELCETCNTGSNDKQKQNCLTCKPNYVIFNHNCLEKCPDGYYESENTCKECNKLCKESGKNCNSCTSCIDGYYLIEREDRCDKCNEHCLTCSNAASEDNENCVTCDINSEYKYLVKATGFGNNCVPNCPNGTKLQDNTTCIIISAPEIVDNKPPEEKSNALIIVFSVIGALVFIAIIIYLFIRFKNRKKKIETFKPDDISNDQLIKEINKDLNLYQSFN